MEARIRQVVGNAAFLLEMEESLADMLSQFVGFREHAIYFPPHPPEAPELIPHEKCLLIPLNWQGEHLGVISLKGVDSRKSRKLLPNLPALLSLCIENLALRRAAKLDAASGLFTEDALLEALVEKMESFRLGSANHGTCPAILVLQWNNVGDTSQRAGLEAIEDAWKVITARMAREIPKNSMAANMGHSNGGKGIAILLETTGRGHCQGVAKTLLHTLRSLSIANPLSEAPLHLGFTAGHALFPHDLSGSQQTAPSPNQAIILRDKAKLAAQTSWGLYGGGALSFSWLLRRGAAITAMLPHGQVRISLGKNCNAQPGQRFQVFPRERLSGRARGQIILRSIEETEAIADIFHVAHPDYPIAPGDRLVLLDTGGDGVLMGQGDFLRYFEETAPGLERHALAITRFLGEDPIVRGDIFSLWNRFMAENPGKVDAAGFYGSDGLITLWRCSREEIVELLGAFHALAETMKLEAATGIHCHPMLDYTCGQEENCCLKALEYAELLPKPHIGFLNEVALTMSGDKLFSQGQPVAAMAEYRLALLLNPANAMALNSLGICLASVNRNEEARKCLLDGLAICADGSLRTQICYNLATLAHKEGRPDEARRWYGQCIRLDHGQFYAWMGFGKILAGKGNLAGARAIYHHAARIAQDTPKLYNLARRYEAKLEQKSHRTDKARELLHDNLLKDPQDTAAMLLLASTYLEDDPKMAEMLARKSLRLGSNGFGILAKALEAQGRCEEARRARQRI